MAYFRRFEMAGIDVGDYDPETRTLHVRKGKFGKARLLPTGERAAAWLDAYLQQARPQFDHLPGEAALFLSGYGKGMSCGSIGNWLKGLMKQCGIHVRGSCHLFRHTCATDMHRGGADIRYVQEMLGHERLETTQIYTHVHIEALREIHLKCHPHGKLGEPLDGSMPPEIDAPQVEETFPPVIEKASPSPSALVEPEPMTCLLAANPTAYPTGHAAPVAAPVKPGQDDEPPASEASIRPQKPKGPVNPQVTINPLVVNASHQRSVSPQEGRVTHYGYRYLDPLNGRWPSRDPIGERGGMNLFAMVWNNPLFWVDFLGLNEAQGISNCFYVRIEVYKPTKNGKQEGKAIPRHASIGIREKGSDDPVQLDSTRQEGDWKNDNTYDPKTGRLSEENSGILYECCCLNDAEFKELKSRLDMLRGGKVPEGPDKGKPLTKTPDGKVQNSPLGIYFNCGSAISTVIHGLGGCPTDNIWNMNPDELSKDDANQSFFDPVKHLNEQMKQSVENGKCKVVSDIPGQP